MRFTCPNCGFDYFHNTAAATGCIIESNEGILFVVRAKEPARGKLGLPGGFVTPGEGALEGLRRECIEEIGLDPGNAAAFLSSFPNIYPYKGITYHTCDLYFTLSLPLLRIGDLKTDPAEISAVRFIKAFDSSAFEELAFDATRKAIQAFLQTKTAH
jgi:ADP-ribose pyrophosphatase YjhB (NUDIX family)